MLRIVLPVALVWVTVSVAAAQLPSGTIPEPPGPDSPAFEVASVKPASQQGLERMISFGIQPNGRFHSSGLPLAMLVQQAYTIRNYQVIGMPAWANTTGFDIAARAPEGTDRAQVGPMLRHLLADRFKLRAHVETRELPVYVLTVEREDGRLGPKLTRSTLDCEAILAERKQQAANNPGGPPPFVPPKPGERPVCATRSNVRPVDGVFTIEQVGSGQPFEAIVSTIASAANRHVIDRTALTGRFDYELQYSPLREAAGLSAAPPGAAPASVPNADGGISLVEAVKALGLKLQADRAPVPVLVIDSVAQPTPD